MLILHACMPPHPKGTPGKGSRQRRRSDIPVGDADLREHVAEIKRWAEARQVPKPPLRYIDKRLPRKPPKRT